MNRDQALYFLEGLTAGIASPSSELAKALFKRLAKEHDLIPPEFELIRPEIDGYLDQAEAEVEEQFKLVLRAHGLPQRAHPGLRIVRGRVRG